MDLQKIGTFLKELRKEKELTQEQLAETLNVSRRTVSRWETGRNMPDISLLKPLASELGITVSELIEGEKQTIPDKSNEESVDQIIEYTVRTRSNNIGLLKDINFVTSVLIILAITLLVVGILFQHLMIPLIVLGILITAFVIRYIFCKCPGCGKTIPYSMRKTISCPRCGMKLVRKEIR